MTRISLEQSGCSEIRNKMNKEGEVVRKKARFVCKGYAQEEGMDYGETFAPIVRLEGVRILIAFVVHKNFKVYQMDVKSTFLNGVLEEEVYIEQLEGFENEQGKNQVRRLRKALYGLKQAPRPWYERLHSYLIKVGFIRTSDNCNLYMKQEKEIGLLIAEIFVDDIIFGGDDKLSDDFVEAMKEFKMSMIVEIKSFIGLQVSQLKGGIFIGKIEYVECNVPTIRVSLGQVMPTK